ncbi:MAG: MFS transporter [Desulfobacterales bacterium]|nr:MFS transporter [Desulfobacterales bacterium]MDJ0853701.1 MFS transporter [Desulfobacterales bacterium]MDJ0988750.1 MFS transporter [Desulfobacterales bacterium]
MPKQAETCPVPQETEAHDDFRAALAPILLLTGIFFLNFMARIIMAPLLPVIRGDLQLDHSGAGHFFLMLSCGYFLALLGSGHLAGRMRHRRVIALSCAGVGLALTAIAWAPSMIGINGGLFALGLAAGIYLPSGIASITDRVAARHWGKALAIHELAPNSAFLLAPLLVEAALGIVDWRTGLMVLGLMALALGGFYHWRGQGAEYCGEIPDRRVMASIAARPAVWLMMLLFAIGISGTLGLYSMLPLYLVSDHGMERPMANTLLALSRVGALAAAGVGGWASDRFGPRTTIRVVFLVSGLLIMVLGVVRGPALMAAVFGQPVLAVCFFPAGFSLLSRISTRRSQNITIAVTIPMAFLIGGGIVPLLLGWMGDAGAFGRAFLLIGMATTLASIATLGLPGAGVDTPEGIA